jgi:hypothetical protein
MIADEEIHQHYNELLSNAGTLKYGRITYQLTKSYWPSVKNPTGNKPMDDFAVRIDNMSKIVYSRTLLVKKSSRFPSSLTAPNSIFSRRIKSKKKPLIVQLERAVIHCLHFHRLFFKEL